VNVACDLDGILANLDGAMLRDINASHGTAFDAEHVVCWDWDQNPHLAPYTSFVWTELYPDDDWHLTIEPVDGALDALETLRLRHTVTLVTARSGDMADLTALWLLSWGFPRLPVVHWTDKAAACQSLRADVLIEDGPHNALAVATSGTPVILFDRAYNRHVEHPLIRRVSGWADALPLLEFIAV